MIDKVKTELNAERETRLQNEEKMLKMFEDAC